MNILYICDEYPPGKNGGIGTMVQVLGRELVKQGHNVFVVGLYPYSYGGQDFENDKGVRVHRLRYGFKWTRSDLAHQLFFRYVPDFIRANLTGRKAFSSLISEINRMIEHESIDVIEIADYNSFAMLIGFPLTWPEFPVPFIVKSHGSYSKICYDTGIIPKKKFVRMDCELFKRADFFSSVSDYNTVVNKHLFGIEGDVRTLYNAVEIAEAFEPLSRDSSTVVYTGSLVAYKGVIQLMKAWNIVAKDVPGAKLLIYGKGDQKTMIKTLSKDTINTVTFFGHVKREEIFKALRMATLSVFPSYSESFSFAPVEAMIMGCPVIFTKRASGPELITDGEDGLLADPDNVMELAAKIKIVLTDTNVQRKLSEKGRLKIMNSFDIKKSAKDHVAFYYNVINDFRRSKPL